MKIPSIILGLSLLASVMTIAQTPASPSPPAPPAPPASAPAASQPAYRAVLTGLTEENAVAVRKALETIPNMKKITVMPKGSFVRIDMKSEKPKLFRKDVETALVTVKGVTVDKFFLLANPAP